MAHPLLRSGILPDVSDSMVAPPLFRNTISLLPATNNVNRSSNFVDIAILLMLQKTIIVENDGNFAKNLDIFPLS